MSYHPRVGCPRDLKLGNRKYSYRVRALERVLTLHLEFSQMSFYKNFSTPPSKTFMVKTKSHSTSFLYIVQSNHMYLPAKCQQISSDVPEFMAKNA